MRSKSEFKVSCGWNDLRCALLSFHNNVHIRKRRIHIWECWCSQKEEHMIRFHPDSMWTCIVLQNCSPGKPENRWLIRWSTHVWAESVRQKRDDGGISNCWYKKAASNCWRILLNHRESRHLQSRRGIWIYGCDAAQLLCLLLYGSSGFLLSWCRTTKCSSVQRKRDSSVGGELFMV